MQVPKKLLDRHNELETQVVNLTEGLRRAKQACSIAEACLQEARDAIAAIEEESEPESENVKTKTQLQLQRRNISKLVHDYLHDRPSGATVSAMVADLNITERQALHWLQHPASEYLLEVGVWHYIAEASVEERDAIVDIDALIGYGDVDDGGSATDSSSRSSIDVHTSGNGTTKKSKKSSRAQVTSSTAQLADTQSTPDAIEESSGSSTDTANGTTKERLIELLDAAGDKGMNDDEFWAAGVPFIAVMQHERSGLLRKDGQRYFLSLTGDL